MTHGHAHEEAEHASHHAEDPFAKSVALSMVVIAALLAGVKVLAHRSHNEYLAYRIKASDEEGKGNKVQTAATSLWNQFQAKKVRESFATQEAKVLLQQTTQGSPLPPAPLPGRDNRLTAIVKDLKDEKVEEPEAAAGKLLDALDVRYKALLAQGYPAGKLGQVMDSEMTAARYREEGKAIAKRASAGEKEAAKHGEKAEKYRLAAEKVHEQSNWFDAGELAVELAIVLSSVAILAKDRRFWYGGMAIAAVGAIIVAVGLFR